MNKTFWLNLSLSLLIISRFLLRYTPQLQAFKYWICFVIVVVSAFSIVINTFNLASKLSKSNKEILKANKRIQALEAEKTNQDNNTITE